MPSSDPLAPAKKYRRAIRIEIEKNDRQLPKMRGSKPSRGRAKISNESPAKMALVTETGGICCVAQSHAASQQTLALVQSAICDIGMRSDAKHPGKLSDERLLANPGGIFLTVRQPGRLRGSSPERSGHDFAQPGRLLSGTHPSYSGY